MLVGVVVIGGGLIALNEFAPAPAPGGVDGAAAGGGAAETGAATAGGGGGATLLPGRGGDTGGSDGAAPAADGAAGTDAAAAGGSADATRPGTAPTPEAPAAGDGTGTGPGTGPGAATGTGTDEAVATGPADAGTRAPAPAPAAGAGDPAVPAIAIAGPAIQVNARPFQSPDGAGLLSVVLYGGADGVLPPGALADITMPLTLAVSPDRPDQMQLARDAGARGQEILAVLPLATGDAAGSGGLTGNDGAGELEAGAARTLAALNMAVGAVAPDGALILDKPEAMAALLKPVASHSFLWIEPRASSRSAAARLAVESDLIFLQANIFVAPGATAEQVLQGMAEAAGQARARGTAIIFIEASGDSLRALVRWGFENGGADVVLAPISAVARKRGKG